MDMNQVQTKANPQSLNLGNLISIGTKDFIAKIIILFWIVFLA